MPVAYLSLGSNLGDRRENLAAAIRRLESPEVRVTAVSAIYETDPIGDTLEPVPPYLNCAARVSTALSPQRLLDHTQAVEQMGGRVRTFRWGPRTIDIDIILFDRLVESGERLVLPHPRAVERAFVLRPLLELTPDLVFPDGVPVRSLLQRSEVAAQGMHRWGDAPTEELPAFAPCAEG